MRVASTLLLLLAGLLPAVALGAESQELAVQVRRIGGAAVAGARICVGPAAGDCRYGTTRSDGAGRALLPGVPLGWLSVTVSAPGHAPVERRSLFHRNAPPLAVLLSPIDALPDLPPQGIRPQIESLQIEDGGDRTQRPDVRLTWHASDAFSHFCVANGPETRGYDSRRGCFDVAPRSRHSTVVPLRTESGNLMPVDGRRYRICLRVVSWDGIASEPVCRLVLYDPR